MPLPRYQPVKKKLKVAGPSLDSLDDLCLARIIAHALQQSKSRNEEPYVGDNGKTERDLSLVSRRWYFLTQTQVCDHGVHKIDFEELSKRDYNSISIGRATLGRFHTSIQTTTGMTPRRMMIRGTNLAGGSSCARTPGTNPLRMRPNGILCQRNTLAQNNNNNNNNNNNYNNNNQQVGKTLAATTNGATVLAYDIRLFRALQPKLLKYTHIQLCGSLTVDNLNKLIMALNSARIERLDLLSLRIDNARSSSANYLKSVSTAKTIGELSHLKTLTYTWTNDPQDDASNALLWTIYERATNLRELQVYLVDVINNYNPNSAAATATTAAPATVATTSSQNAIGNSVQQANHMTPAPKPRSAICEFNGKLSAPLMNLSHPFLVKVVFNRLAPSVAACEQMGANQVVNCDYSILIKRLLSQERSIQALDTNDCSLIEYLIHASNRLCTKHELRSLKLTHPIKTLDLLEQLVRLQHLGADFLSIVIDNIDMIADVKSTLENFTTIRSSQARCRLNLYLKDQKFPDCDDKVKYLINLCRMADVNVYISALQRISIDCCHLMWSTGRALQAITNDSPGKCIFKISLQTYPIKPNTVNPCEITVPFGRCSQYKISSSREDIARHREIMRALKRDCYHQFVKSVRENNTP